MDSVISSPDPLNDSATYQSPAKPRRASKARHSLLLDGSSPTKQTFELDVGNQLSPQKIRVTVEAGNSDTENGHKHADRTSPIRRPVNRRRERTTTTTIPVKGLSDSEEETAVTPKRGRGRPRKSIGTPVPAKKRGRASTPTQKNKGRRKSIGSLVDGDDEEDVNFLFGHGVEVGRGKGRSRSRSIKGASKSTPAARNDEVSDKIISSTTSKKGRGRRKTLVAEEVVVLEDEIGGNMESNETPELAEMSGALLPIDANSGNHPSAYSTIRSTMSGYGEPDVTIARFNPGNETPRQTGWSSPRLVESVHLSSPGLRSNSFPSPEKTPRSYYGEDSVAMVPVSPEKQAETIDENEDHQYEDEEDDRVGELREFDTILESEGFSMISVDSVPSLRDHMSSPVNQEQEKGSTKSIKNKSILSIQNMQGKDDSFSSIPDEILQAATPGKIQNQKLLSVQNTRLNDSFSSIPPDILEAATPARKTYASKLLASTKSRIDDSFSSITPEVLEAATPGRPLTRQSSALKVGEAYDDSFSAIPSAILDAATPAPLRKSFLKPDDQNQSAMDKLSVPGPSRNLSPAQRNDQDSSTRLPTPEDTPSPPGDPVSHQSSGSSSKDSVNLSKTTSINQNSGTESSIISQMRSSPPSVAPRRYTYTAHLRQHRALFPDQTQTPSIVFSSPSLPPPIQFSKGHPFFTSQAEQQPRPKLSPTVRAGRVLQGIVVPSSPRGRAQSLGSPFKSPVAERKSSSVAGSNLSPTQERQAKPLSRLDEAGNLFFNQSQGGKWNSSVDHEDPFSNNAPMQQRSPSPEDKKGYTLEIPEQRRALHHRLSGLRSEGDSLRSEDAMSWQAEEEQHINDAPTSLVNHINSSSSVGQPSTGSGTSFSNGGESAESSEQKWTAERDAVRRQIESASTSQVIVIDSDDEVSGSSAREEDDDFGLLLETLNSSSPAIPERQEQPKGAAADKPRRSKIPSPWRKHSKRLVYNDELSHLSSPPNPPGIPFAKQFTKEHVEDDELDLSEFPIPQKVNFNPRIRERGNLNLSDLLASSPNKVKLPVLPRSSGNTMSFDKGPTSHNTSTVRRIIDSSSESQPQLFNPTPQKMGFNSHARGRSTEGSIFSSSPVKQQPTSGIFGIANKSCPSDLPTPEVPSSSSGLKPLGLSSPSRTNSLPVPAQRTPIAQRAPSVCDYESNSSSLLSHEEKENQFIDNRTLKWTETVRLASTEMQGYTSPTKSCLRSPLKTPSAGSGSGNSGSPTKNVAFVSSSPIPSSPVTESLSSTIWSRDHWDLLDSILQCWKPEYQKDGQERRRRNSTRVISRLLGKNIKSDGEKMKLEQWHLEVVDEFRGYVNGWQEVDIAKRVFALLVGEEKRALMAEGRKEKAGEEVF